MLLIETQPSRFVRHTRWCEAEFPVPISDAGVCVAKKALPREIKSSRWGSVLRIRQWSVKTPSYWAPTQELEALRPSFQETVIFGCAKSQTCDLWQTHDVTARGRGRSLHVTLGDKKGAIDHSSQRGERVRLPRLCRFNRTSHCVWASSAGRCNKSSSKPRGVPLPPRAQPTTNALVCCFTP